MYRDTWPKGAEVRIEASLSPSFEDFIGANPDLAPDIVEKIRESMTTLTLEPTSPVYRVHTYKIQDNDERFTALAPHLDPVTESIDSMFVRLSFGGEGEEFMKFLLERAVIARETFECEYIEFLNSQRG
jgi:hypothetical protein